MEKKLFICLIAFAILQVLSADEDVLQYNSLKYQVPYMEFLFSSRCDVSCLLSDNQTCRDTCLRHYDSTIVKFDFLEDENFSVVLKPYLVCQDLKQKNNRIMANVVISWSSVSTLTMYLPKIYIVQVCDLSSENLQCQIIGSTTQTIVTIEDLEVARLYKFQVTAIVSFDQVLHPIESDQISVIDSGEINPPSVFKVVNFSTNEETLDAFVNWTASKEMPCSYNVLWFPLTGDDYFDQETITQPRDSLPIKLKDLQFGTNYTIEVTPVTQLHGRTTNSLVSSFMTPCTYKKNIDLKSCEFGPPQNLIAQWIEDDIQVKWSPPSLFKDSEISLIYYLTIWKDEADLKHFIHRQKIVENKTEVLISGIEFQSNLSIELFSTVDDIMGASAFAHLIVSGMVDVESLLWNPLWIACTSISVAILLFVLLFLLNRRRSSRRGMKDVSISGLIQGSIPSHLLPYYIPSWKIQLQEVIGQGAFGIVHRAQIRSGNTDTETVAVKEYKSLPFEDAQSEVYHEVELMQFLNRHNHIARLFGFTITLDRRVMLIVEYCPLGDLLTWLHAQRREKISIYEPCPRSGNSTTDFEYDWSKVWTKLLCFMHQVANGMAYISSHKLVHSDIAARNILMCSEKLVKIGDFGCARDIYESKIYIARPTRKMPIRWMAIETLQGHVFTTMSDVWSYGILMWEMASFGSHPYSMLQNECILSSLLNGVRLKQPEYCDNELYGLMLSCWHREPFRRPQFTELQLKLGRILESQKNYLQITQM